MSRFHINSMTLALMAVMTLWYSQVLSQTLETDAPAQQKLWEIFLKLIFPTIWTAVAPWVTGLVTSGIKHVPTPLRVMISSVLGAIMAGVAGTIPDFPLSPESAATMGAAGGATGQILSNLDPSKLKPKTEAVKAELKAELNKGL